MNSFYSSKSVLATRRANRDTRYPRTFAWLEANRKRWARGLTSALLQIARTAFAEPHELVIEKHKVRLKRLPPSLDGLRVVHLTDIHHSPLTGEDIVMRAVEAANKLEPDIIALTGDYVSHEREYAAPVAAMMGKLKAKYGVFAVLGNHDHWTDAALIKDLLELENIKVLSNEGLHFEVAGESIWLAGADDTMVGLEDVSLALAGSRRDEMKLLLAHNPLASRRAARLGVDLVLAGHTHGGQVTWRSETSLSGKPRRRLLKGLGRQGETQVYVSRGLGTVVFPVRYGCKPEVALLELTRDNG